jgi:hypothetical protein
MRSGSVFGERVFTIEHLLNLYSGALAEKPDYDDGGIGSVIMAVYGEEARLLTN